MPSEEERIAKTESVFRHVNERIAEVSEQFGTGEAEFVCECADPSCHHRVEVPLDEYEDVRADATQFVVVEGHEVPKYERVIERGRDYAVVRKLGRRLAAAVRRTDPRAETT